LGIIHYNNLVDKV
jgi:putative addiction module killer protein/probable addiction module antidote protein